VSACSNFTRKLDYSSVAKMNLPKFNVIERGTSTETSIRGHTFRSEVKSHASSGLTLEDYGRTLHRMGDSSTEGTAERAESVLRDILEKYSNGTHEIQPDGACYNSVIHSYADVGKAEKAESVLRLMFKDYQDGNEKAEPNVRVYTNVLHAWRKAKAPNAPERCEAILKEMYELSDKGILPSCKPDTFAVTVS
jgi:pentatricopeptide repeat protein